MKTTTENTAQHTPGPWTASSDGKIPVAIANLKRKVGIAIVESGLGHGPVDFREVAANARLIAAAPELLTALESTSAALDQARMFIADNLTTRAASEELVASWTAQNQARAAIAKAKGVQS